MSSHDVLTWKPTADEVRVIVTEMRPILEAAAQRAEHALERAN